MQVNNSAKQVNDYKRNIFAAAKNNDGTLINSFLQNGSLQLDAVLNDEDQSLLHTVCIGGSEDVLDLLLQSQKVVDKIELRDGQKRTAIHYSAALGFTTIISKLLAVEAAIDPQDDAGATPLQLAVRFEWVETVQFLLEAGANPMIEDYEGYNSVDVALSKGGDIANLLSGFEGQRRQTTLLQSLRQLVFPLKKLRPIPRLSPEDERERPPAPVAPIFFDDIFGDHVLPPEEMDEPAAMGSPGASSSGQAPLAPKPFKGDTTGATRSRSSNLPQNVCLLHKFFDEGAKRLEFEIEWQHARPAVGVVKPGGQAERRGVVQGDQIVEIAGQSTEGKGRDELLPLLKERPLSLKIHREVEVVSEPQPHCDLTLCNAGSAFNDQGMEIKWEGSVPRVSKVRPNSNAWAAGVLEGDAIVHLNGREAAKSTRSVFNPALEEQLRSIVVRRAPLTVASSSE